MSDEGITPLPGPIRDAETVIVFGGVFDPPHLGHVEMPVRVRGGRGGGGGGGLAAAWLLYVPAARSPHKPDGPITGDHHRVAMLELATRDVERCAIWTDEIDRGGRSSYTIDTLVRLRRVLGGSVRLRLLIGADQAGAFHRWREYGAIMELAEPVVMLREPAESADAVLESLRASGAWTSGRMDEWRCWIVPGGRFDASSTRVRQLLHESDDPLNEAELSRLMDRRVLGYIVEHGLYR